MPEFFCGVDGCAAAVVVAEIGVAKKRRDAFLVGEVLSDESAVGVEFGAGESAVAHQGIEHGGLREVVFAQAFVFADEDLLVHAVDPHKKDDPGDTVKSGGHAAVDHLHPGEEVPSHDEEQADRGDRHGAADSPVASLGGDVAQHEQVTQSKDPAQHQYRAIRGWRAIFGAEEDVAVEHRFFGECGLAPVATAGQEHGPDCHENERGVESLGRYTRLALGDGLKNFDPQNQNKDDRRHPQLQKSVLQLQWGKGSHDLQGAEKKHRDAEGIAVKLIAGPGARWIHPIQGDVK